MKRICCLLVLCIFCVGYSRGQHFNRMYIDAAGHQSLKYTVANAGITLEFESSPRRGKIPRYFENPAPAEAEKTSKEPTKKRPKYHPPVYWGPGLGADYWFNNETRPTWLIDVHLYISLKRNFRCFFPVIWTSWYAMLHYKFDTRFSNHFICPELGYNFMLSQRFALAPFIQQYFPVNRAPAINNLFVGLKLSFLFEPRVKLDKD